MSSFKTFVEKGNYSLQKNSSIPKALEEPLHALDMFVTQRYNRLPMPEKRAVEVPTETSEANSERVVPTTEDIDNVISSSSSPRNTSSISTTSKKGIRYRNIDKTSGFHEAIQEILGGKINLGRIKYTLQKLRLRSEAAVLKEELDSLVDAFIPTLKGRVLKCPLSMQPTLKAKASAAIKASSALPPPGKGQSATPLIDASESEVQNKDEQLSTAGDEAEQDGKEATSAQSNPTSATQSSQDASSNPSQLLGQTAKIVVNKTEKTVVISYEFYCKWDIPLRAELLDIEESIALWVQVSIVYNY